MFFSLSHTFVDTDIFYYLQRIRLCNILSSTNVKVGISYVESLIQILIAYSEYNKPCTMEQCFTSLLWIIFLLLRALQTQTQKKAKAVCRYFRCQDSESGTRHFLTRTHTSTHVLRWCKSWGKDKALSPVKISHCLMIKRAVIIFEASLKLMIKWL